MRRAFFPLSFLLVALMLFPASGADGELRFFAAEPFVDYAPPNVDLSTLKPAERLSAFATPGEYEPLTCLLSSPTGIGKLAVAASDLRMGERRVPAENIDLRVVKYWFQRGFLWKGKELIPELLVHDDNLVTVDIPGEKNILNFEGLPEDAPRIVPFAVPAGTVKQLWITIHVPPGTDPGIYRGELTFTADEKIIARLPLELEALAFTLHKPIKNYGIYCHSKLSGDTLRESRKRPGVWSVAGVVTEEMFRLHCADLKAHGITSPQFNMPLRLREDGTLDFTLVKKMMDIREEYGLKEEPFFVVGLPEPEDVMDSPEKTEQYLRMVRQVLDFFHANGWQKPYIYVQDEAQGKRLESLLPLYRKIKETGAQIAQANFPNAQTSRREKEPGWLEISGDTISLSIVAQHRVAVPRSEIDRAHELGLKIWFYALPQSHWDEYAPYVYRNNYGFWLFSSPADGIAPWGYQMGKGNPYDDFDAVKEGEITDCFAIYPTRSGIVPTLIWEAFREGIDDCRYASTLSNLVARARGMHGDAPLLRDVEQWMKAQEVAYVHVMENLDDPDNFKPMLVYNKELKEQLSRRPNLQELRRGFADRILQLLKTYPALAR